MKTSPKLPKKKHQHVHIMSNERREWWWIYGTSMCKKSKLDKCSKNDDFSKIHINLIGELQCIFNPSKVIKPFNSHYFQLYNTYYVKSLQKLFQNQRLMLPLVTMRNSILWVLEKKHHTNLTMDQKMLLVL